MTLLRQNARFPLARFETTTVRYWYHGLLYFNNRRSLYQHHLPLALLNVIPYLAQHITESWECCG